MVKNVPQRYGIKLKPARGIRENWAVIRVILSNDPTRTLTKGFSLLFIVVVLFYMVFLGIYYLASIR